MVLPVSNPLQAIPPYVSTDTSQSQSLHFVSSFAGSIRPDSTGSSDNIAAPTAPTDVLVQTSYAPRNDIPQASLSCAPPPARSRSSRLPRVTIEEEFEHLNISDVSDSEDDGDVTAVAGDLHPPLQSSAVPQDTVSPRPVSPRAGFRQPVKQTVKRQAKQTAKDVHHFVQQDVRDPNLRYCSLCLYVYIHFRLV